ncbi:LysM domain-containing protein [Filibacter tadaridae]|uniref:Spore coat assembly protein ExsA n=1 Tax=Filibacter tadaridae TaxID=2483811 RepID=A0A3P5XTZ9_9BACL|nr:LysM domain-containing protein [Filibacter tadaridae]VDC32597.1 Spore coat assembly protein ExsA [Filibacter tadaridae]
MEVHIVAKGDTLWKIARQHGIPFEELKRVNAHLANPDYIVPGMKIFLPDNHSGTKGGQKGGGKVPGKGPVKTPDKVKKPEKPAPPTQEKPGVPSTPIPLPKPVSPPTPTPKPLPTPTPKPTPKPLPPVQEEPPVQQQPSKPTHQHHTHACVHQVMGIPCGWMPIYDADCHSYIHSGQIQAIPVPEIPSHQEYKPAPIPKPQPIPQPLPPMQKPPHQHYPYYEMDHDESPIYPSHGPTLQPPTKPMPDGWQLLESPEILVVEPPTCEVEPSVSCPPEDNYVPQVVPPVPQPNDWDTPISQPTDWSPPQYMPHLTHHGCGCGCHDAGQYQMMPPMGHSQMIPMGYYPMMHPAHQAVPCNCQPGNQAMPHQMSPVPYQGSNWPGTY